MQIVGKFIRMLTGHEVHTKANIEYPSYRSRENRNGSTVNFGNILRRNEETTNQKYAYND